jgi:3-oxo-5-alpha-steroid 4-dehydrogenase 1
MASMLLLQHWMALGMLAASAVTFALLVCCKKRAAYGRYAAAEQPSKTRCPSLSYGPPVNGRVAWVLQECPCLLVCAALLLLYTRPQLAMPNLVLLACFELHYVHRTLVFPLRIRGGKPTPLGIMLMAMAFCAYNGFMQTSFLLLPAQQYAATWLRDPRFLLGVLLFAVGMAVNIHADSVLINLRKPGETGYKIPYGGAFRWVSGANFAGECLEWLGFALAAWSVVALSFAVFALANLAPRAAQHHADYLRRFPRAYPLLRRKKMIPFVW